MISNLKVEYRIALKYILIISLIYLFQQIMFTISYNPNISNTKSGDFRISFLLPYLLILVCIALAHKEYYQKTNLLLIRSAFVIGLAIIVAAYFSSYMIRALNYNIFLQNKIPEPNGTGLTKLMNSLEHSHKPVFNPFVSIDSFSSLYYNFQVIIFNPNILALILILNIEGLVFIFKKAGRNGWYALIPFYNIYTLIDITGKPKWWIFMLLIPGVNLIFWFYILLQLVKDFGKDSSFAVGLFFLPFIFFPLLGLSTLNYIEPVNSIDKELISV